jgi:hypothetical protein
MLAGCSGDVDEVDIGICEQLGVGAVRTRRADGVRQPCRTIQVARRDRHDIVARLRRDLRTDHPGDPTCPEDPPANRDGVVLCHVLDRVRDRVGRNARMLAILARVLCVFRRLT